MLDIRLIREKPDYVKERLTLRGGDSTSLVDAILESDSLRRSLETQLQKLNADRKRISKEIGMHRAKGEETTGLWKPRSVLWAMILPASTRRQRRRITASAIFCYRSQICLILPPPSALMPMQTPWCASGAKNQRLPPRATHLEVGAALGLFDLGRAARMSGSAFACFTGQGARLERALINFMLDLHTREHGYPELSPPFIVRKEALIGTGQLPKFEEQLYRCERDELYLAPTAEVPVTNFHSRRNPPPRRSSRRNTSPIPLLPSRGRVRRPWHPRPHPRPSIRQG